MIRAAIYIRVSSDKQAQEGDSIPAQVDALQKYIADRPDLVLVGTYIDDGVSGTKEDRDELQRMLADVRQGKIDKILVTKLDRLYRSIRHYLNLQDTLDKCGVNWLAIWEPIYDTSTPQGRLIINQMMSIAQFEAENTGQRIRQVFDYKAAQGEVLSGQPPCGYDIVNKKLVPNATASAVREAFETYSMTGNLNETVARMQGRGLPQAKPSMKNILTNTKYIGLFRGNPNYCPPIVSQELFYDVQRKLGINVKKSQKHTYIFSGLLKCGECGRSLAANTRKRVRGNCTTLSQQYRCPAHFASTHHCDNAKVVTEHALEVMLIGMLRDQLEGMRINYQVKEKKAKTSQAQVQKTERKIERLKELYINDLITLEEYKADKEKLTAELARLTQEPKKKETTYIDKLLKSDIETLYWSFTPEEKRYLWRSLIDHITIDKNRNYVFHWLE